MNDFLKKINFIRPSNLELNLDKSTFYEAFSKLVDDEEISIFTEPFEVFSFSKKKYIGQVRYGHFKIKKRKRFFDFNPFKPVATGIFSQKGDSLRVDFETNAFKGVFAWMSIIPLLFLMFLSFAIIGDFDHPAIESEILIMLIANLIFIASIWIALGRYNSKKFKQELEHQFYQLNNKPNQGPL